MLWRCEFVVRNEGRMRSGRELQILAKLLPSVSVAFGASSCASTIPCFRVLSFPLPELAAEANVVHENVSTTVSNRCLMNMRIFFKVCQQR